jgi:hypothetical protein
MRRQVAWLGTWGALTLGSCGGESPRCDGDACGQQARASADHEAGASPGEAPIVAMSDAGASQAPVDASVATAGGEPLPCHIATLVSERCGLCQCPVIRSRPCATTRSPRASASRRLKRCVTCSRPPIRRGARRLRPVGHLRSRRQLLPRHVTAGGRELRQQARALRKSLRTASSSCVRVLARAPVLLARSASGEEELP